MKVAIVPNQKLNSINIAHKISILLRKFNHEISQDNPELVISVGGDGTLLSAFHLYNHLLSSVRFVGVHTGNLGFYTDFRDYELNHLIQFLNQKNISSISYPLLEIIISYYDNNVTKKFLVLNECTIKSSNSIMIADIYINDEFFERFRGDGLSVSTPTGSTAYNKSIGGAVIHPEINAFQLTEIASLNNRIFRTLGSPMVMHSNEHLKIKINHGIISTFSIDHFIFTSHKVKSIFYRIASERIHFISYNHTKYWKRVRESFI